MKQLVLSEWLLTQLSQAHFPARMPAHRRVYEAIRRAITEQVLPSGARLPSTRSLAIDLTVSRNTILAAFEQLLDEGYVEAITGSGTYVTYDNVSYNKLDLQSVSFANHQQPSKNTNTNKKADVASHSLINKNTYADIVEVDNTTNVLSKRGLAATSYPYDQFEYAVNLKQTSSDFTNKQETSSQSTTYFGATNNHLSHSNLTEPDFVKTSSSKQHVADKNFHHEVQPFTPGEDDYSCFPTALWRRLLNRQWRTLNPELLDSSHDGGYLPLRVAIADYLRVSRAVHLTVDQVIITAGTQQSIDLCARLLTDHNDIAWIENPCYWAARRVLEINGLQLHPVNIDNEGMAPSNTDFRVKPRLIYTTPSHQYPKGMVMSYGRRRLLLDYAQSNGAWIIEDDYDSEFRFEGRPISSLQGMDQHGRVLYLGTFSKVMYPGIRLGFMVVPPKLVDAFKNGLYELQRPGQVMIQAALADFIEEGHFASHIRRLKQIYAERRRLLQTALASISDVGATLSPVDSGLHLVVTFDAHCNDVLIAEMAAGLGLRVYPLSRYCFGSATEKGLIIGYAYAATDSITHYGNMLAKVIESALSK